MYMNFTQRTVHKSTYMFLAFFNDDLFICIYDALCIFQVTPGTSAQDLALSPGTICQALPDVETSFSIFRIWCLAANLGLKADK